MAAGARGKRAAPRNPILEIHQCNDLAPRYTPNVPLLPKPEFKAARKVIKLVNSVKKQLRRIEAELDEIKTDAKFIRDDYCVHTYYRVSSEDSYTRCKFCDHVGPNVNAWADVSRDLPEGHPDRETKTEEEIEQEIARLRDPDSDDDPLLQVYDDSD